jgi:beta-N-acetylhexosaminidase
MMKNTLRNLLISILLCLPLVLSGCGSAGGDRNSGGNNTSGPAQQTEEKPPSYEQLAQNILAGMTAEEKVGQMFFVRCRKDTAIADLDKYRLGGYILFAEDVKGNTKESLKSKLQSYQDASKIGLLIGVDEEGGDIVRVSKYPEFRAVPFHSPQSLYAEGGFDLIASDTKEKAKLLKSLGFNINLAPVCDVSENPSDYIYARTFGKGADEAAKYVKTVVQTMNANGIGCTLKHFPGYGNNADTHKGLSVDNRSYDTFVNSDFIPFKAGIKAGAGSILVSHNIVKCMDANLPASLSPAVHKILREDLGFQGVIMTDDLKMNAIKEYIGDQVSAVLAIKAGNDLVVASDFDVQIPSVLAAVKDGNITEDRLNESVLRILEWKLRLGIISS